MYNPLERVYEVRMGFSYFQMNRSLALASLNIQTLFYFFMSVHEVRPD